MFRKTGKLSKGILQEMQAATTAKNYMMPITDEEFENLSQFIYARFGIHLTAKKRALLVSRLQKMLQKKAFANFASFYEYLISANDESLLDDLVNRITTNFTYFWRESDHYEYMQNVVLPELSHALKKKKMHDLRIWCAGCSTGEEAYMLAMLVKEHLGIEYFKWKAGILATDISLRVLDLARTGVYPATALERLPGLYKKRYFRQISKEEWAVKDFLKQEVTFRRFNLINPLPFKKPFHLIFCRNVMIYFDAQTRINLIRRFFQCTEPGGYLFIGHSESLDRRQSPYEYVLPAVYKKPEAGRTGTTPGEELL